MACPPSLGSARRHPALRQLSPATRVSSCLHVPNQRRARRGPSLAASGAPDLPQAAEQRASQKHQSSTTTPAEPSVVLAPILPSTRRPRAPDASQWCRVMNLDLKTYTPLESLLLFQSLATYGVDAPSFSRISDLLKKNPHINSHERYQSGRLSPDALRNFYSHLLKEQIKLERQNGVTDAEGQNGEVRNSRKRKAPSPNLPTVQEAAQDSSLIPKLVENLYATYRRALTNQIREDEQRYERLQKDLQAIERGEWDQHMKEKANGKSPVYHSFGECASSRRDPTATWPRASEWTAVGRSQCKDSAEYIASEEETDRPCTFHTPTWSKPSSFATGAHATGRTTSSAVSPQDPTRAQPQPILPQYHQVSTPVANRQPSTYSGPPTAASARAGLPPIYPPVNQGRSSFGTPLGMHTPQSGIQTPRSAKTLWKPSAKVVATPPAPRPEVSPIDDLSPPKPSKQTQQKEKTTRKPRARGKAKEKEKETEAEEAREPIKDPTPEPDTRQSRSRRKATTRRGRPGSIASSQAGGSIRERSRSRSIISHTETIAADNESQAGNRVKSERGTSVEMIEEDPAGTPSQPPSRGRRATATRAATGKRKRGNREPSIAESDDRRTTPGLPRTVIVQRQFAKTCAQMMDGIESHKHASIFSDKVKAKDAEGYYDIIKRPTSLKEIRKAINTGTKAIASAVSDTPAASPGGSGGFVELPLTLDLVPPKAIVNSGQLERELMRMFVNAVMFNPGEEGVVEDAREMSETAQSQISIWRNINHQGSRLEIEETPPVPTPVEEEVTAPAPKRRKH
ncbi:Bromodomain-containing protein [Lophiotrema nucula]|uniref:Bromodomain-containing protein n=1 Tax=Lophiotrema nucula TaxID=690887 RepID=A0A6A5Z8T5_9PLEO|nr:Bromodomain-containing protein [Lophiotrema nucula]